MVKTAVILAAGLGSRLKDRTKEIPKGFISVGGKPLITRSIESLIRAGIERIIIGTGHASEVYEEFARNYSQLECLKNERFADTGSMYTLYNLRHLVNDDFLLLESDLLYDPRGLTVLLSAQSPNVILASGPTRSNDEVFIETDSNGFLVKMSKNPADLAAIYAELVGITRISYPTFLKMCQFAEREFPHKPKLDYEYALVGISPTTNIWVEKIDDYVWCEIDDENHLDRAVRYILPKIKERESNA